MKYILMLTLLFLMGCSSTTKKNTGIVQGEFYPCPTSPNCVSSMAPENDSHFIKPIIYEKITRKIANKKIVEILNNLKNTKIIESNDKYIHVEIRSSFFKFVDDIEFYFPTNKNIIHIRSLSRTGHSDFGVNRKRMEKIRVKFYE